MVEDRDQDRMRKLLVRGLGWVFCVVLWTAALLTLYPVHLGESILPSTLQFPLSKVLHVSAYAFLTTYIFWLPLGRWRWLLLAFLSLHAACTEYFQQFVPGRHGMISDVFIDHAGLLLGFALAWKRWMPRLNNGSFSREPKGSASLLARSPSARG